MLTQQVVAKIEARAAKIAHSCGEGLKIVRVNKRVLDAKTYGRGIVGGKSGTKAFAKKVTKSQPGTKFNKESMVAH